MRVVTVVDSEFPKNGAALIQAAVDAYVEAMESGTTGSLVYEPSSACYASASAEARSILTGSRGWYIL